VGTAIRVGQSYKRPFKTASAQAIKSRECSIAARVTNTISFIAESEFSAFWCLAIVRAHALWVTSNSSGVRAGHRAAPFLRSAGARSVSQPSTPIDSCRSCTKAMASPNGLQGPPPRQPFGQPVPSRT
jgi:hypothetical protein